MNRNNISPKTSKMLSDAFMALEEELLTMNESPNVTVELDRGEWINKITDQAWSNLKEYADTSGDLSEKTQEYVNSSNPEGTHIGYKIRIGGQEAVLERIAYIDPES